MMMMLEPNVMVMMLAALLKFGLAMLEKLSGRVTLNFASRQDICNDDHADDPAADEDEGSR